MPSAPLAVSSQPTKKVKTSGHDKQPAGEDEKENVAIFSDDNGAGWENDEHGEVISITDPAFPQTPAVRIPLEDLIGNTEDAFNCPQPLATPGDHVIWHDGPASSDPSVSAHGTQKVGSELVALLLLHRNSRSRPILRLRVRKIRWI